MTLQDVGPVVLLDGRYPVACGFEASAPLRDQIVRLTVLNRKTAGGSEFAIAVAGAGSVASLEVSAGEVKDSEGFSPLTQLPGGGFERTRAFSPDDGALFIHALMVSGGSFRLGVPPGDATMFLLTGPLPQSVRAAYLNCAGDLVRPEE